MTTKLKEKSGEDLLQQDEKKQTSSVNPENNIEILETEEVKELFEKLPEKEKKEIIASIVMEQYSGPLPHPNHLREYEKIQKGSASRIIGMTEKQVEHRIECEKKIVDANIGNSRRGQIFAFILALVVICIGFCLILLNKSTTGIVMILTPLASLVGIFVLNKYKENRMDSQEPNTNSDERQKRIESETTPSE